MDSFFFERERVVVFSFVDSLELYIGFSLVRVQHDRRYKVVSLIVMEAWTSFEYRRTESIITGEYAVPIL